MDLWCGAIFNDYGLLHHKSFIVEFRGEIILKTGQHWHSYGQE